MPKPLDVLEKESEIMALEIIDGNPGACVIVGLLLSSPLRLSILRELKNQKLIGSELWRIVHDDFEGDWGQFVRTRLRVAEN